MIALFTFSIGAIATSLPEEVKQERGSAFIVFALATCITLLLISAIDKYIGLDK